MKTVVQCKWGAFVNRDRNANDFVLILVLVLLGLPYGVFLEATSGRTCSSSRRDFMTPVALME